MAIRYPVDWRESVLSGPRYLVDWRDSVLWSPRYAGAWRDPVLLAPQVPWGQVGSGTTKFQQSQEL